MRAAALITEQGRVAAIERNRDGNVYYLFPGGKVEAGETSEEAVVREVREELGLEVEVGRLIAEVAFGANVQLYYLASVVGGRFGTGEGAEYSDGRELTAGTYAPVWLEIDGVLGVPLRPRCVAELLAESGRAGWPSEVLRCREG